MMMTTSASAENSPTTRLRRRVNANGWPRYLYKDAYSGGVTFYRFNPPEDARRAGLMRGITIGTIESEAFEKADELNAIIDAWRSGDKGVTDGVELAGDTISDLIDAYKQSVHFTRIKKKTKDGYLIDLNMLSELSYNDKRFVSTKLTDVTTELAQEFYEGVRDNISLSTATSAVYTLQRLYNLAIKWRLVYAKPWTSVDVPKHDPMNYNVNVEHIQALHSACLRKAHWRAVGTIFFMAVDLGMAMTDVARLRASELTNEQKERLTHVTSALVFSVMSHSNPDGYLVADRYGEPFAVTYFSTTLHRVRKAAGIPADIQTRDLLSFARQNPY